MVSVFEFEENFRDYLKMVIEEKGYSYRGLGEKSGLNGGTLHSIANRKTHLSPKYALKLSKIFKHNKYEKDYFVQLVQFTQAEDPEEKKFYEEKMVKIKSELAGAERIKIDIFDYYKGWHHSAIRSLLPLYPFNDDYPKIVEVLTRHGATLPAISAEEAKESVELLKRLGLIHKNNDGSYFLNDNVIWDNISPEGKKKFHLQCCQKVLNQIKHTYLKNDCKVFNATLGMSRKTYDFICNEMEELLKKTLALVQNDKEADRVYQCQLAVVPLSNSVSQECRMELSSESDNN